MTTFTRRGSGDWFEHLPNRGEPTVMTVLDGDRPVDRGGERTRWRLSCRVCGDRGAVVPARREKLLPLLDKLADAGIPHISLRGLAANL